MGIPADSTPQGKLLSSARMLDVKRTLTALKSNGLKNKNKGLLHMFSSLMLVTFGATGHWGSSDFGMLATLWKSS